MTTPPEAIELAIELANFIAGPLPRGTTGATKVDALGLETGELIAIALEIEDRFGAVVPDQEALDWRTLEDIAQSIAPRMQEQAA